MLIPSSALDQQITTAVQRLESLIKANRSRPAWQPIWTHTDTATKLVSELNDQYVKLLQARAQLNEEQDRLIVSARRTYPFVCPDELRSRLRVLDSLQSMVNRHDRRGVVGLVDSHPAAIGWLTLNRVSKLPADSSRRSLEKAAEEYATKWAHLGSPQWNRDYERELKKLECRWPRLKADVAKHFADAQKELSECQRAHRAHLEAKLSEDDRIVSAQDRINQLVASCKSHITNGMAIYKRDKEIISQLHKVREIVAKQQHSYKFTGSFDGTDNMLVEKWTNDCDVKNREYWSRTMHSARMAELIAIHAVYNRWSLNVEDLSRLQIEQPFDRRWQQADLATGGRLIDVKNARESFASERNRRNDPSLPMHYVEHCVPRFKTDRRRKDVVISGFLSPYPIGFTSTWLGETKLQQITALAADFGCDRLTVDFGDAKLGNRLPPWLFDYPLTVYEERNSALNELRSDEQEWPAQRCSVTDVVLAGRVPQDAVGDPLGMEALALQERIRDPSNHSRPVLFLHVLRRFIIAIAENRPFPASEIRQALGAEQLSEGTRRGRPEYQAVLGVCDPLSTIVTLIDVLADVARHCPERVREFQRFRLRGSGILRGSVDGDQWQTVFAYCGGWDQLPDGTPVRCGQEPLYLGQNEPCPGCGYLICHRCGHCSRNCSNRDGRQQMWHS